MQLIPRIAVAALVASSVPVLPFIAIGLIVLADPDLWQLFGLFWLVSLGHVIFLGLPAFALLLRTSRANRWSMLLVGFVLGATPVAIASYFGHSSSSPSGLAAFGFMGAIAARVFWAFWCRLGPNNSFKPKPLRGSA